MCVNAFNPPLTVLIVAVDNCQGPSLLSAVRLSRGPVGPHVAFLALEQEALVPEKLPAWMRERPPAESLLTYRFIILNQLYLSPVNILKQQAFTRCIYLFLFKQKG